jgi:site-specific DNA-methyltransferase (adenine-specific)
LPACFRLRRFRITSGTTGKAAAKNGRAFCMVDQSAEAIAVMEKRLQLKAERI